MKLLLALPARDVRRSLCGGATGARPSRAWPLALISVVRRRRGVPQPAGDLTHGRRASRRASAARIIDVERQLAQRPAALVRACSPRDGRRSTLVVAVVAYVTRAEAVPDRPPRPGRGVRRRVPAPGARRLPHRVPDARRRRRDDGVVAVHEEHVEPGVDLLRQRPAVPQPAGGARRRSPCWRGCCSGSPTRRGGSGRGGMFWPMLVFTGFVVLGLLRGKVDGRRHAGRHLRVPAAALHARRLRADHEPADDPPPVPPAAAAVDGRRRRSRASSRCCYYRGLPDAERDVLESLSEHSATIHDERPVRLPDRASWLLQVPRWLRWTMFLLAHPGRLGLPAVAAAGGDGRPVRRRRSSLIVVLYYRRRRAFWFVAPVTLVVGVGLRPGRRGTRQGAIGLPGAGGEVGALPRPARRGRPRARTCTARSRRSTSTSRSSRTRSSGSASARSSCTPSPLPDISFFEFWEYIPHNSVLWIWIKIGLLRLRRDAVHVRPGGPARRPLGRSACAPTSTPRSWSSGSRYVVMFLVFAYVDIAWDLRSTVFLGAGVRAVRRLRAGPSTLDAESTGVARAAASRSVPSVSARGRPRLAGRRGPRRRGSPAAASIAATRIELDSVAGDDDVVGGDEHRRRTATATTTATRRRRRRDAGDAAGERRRHGHDRRRPAGRDRSAR